MNVLADGRLPETSTHTFTAEGYRWINHENLSEIALALLTRLGGGTGLLLFKCALGLVVLGLILFRAKREAGVMLASLLTMVVAINLTAGWTLRPQLFSYTLFAVMIALLDSAFANFRTNNEVRYRYLWGVIPVVVIWTNSHGGFVAGCAIFGLYLVCRAGEAVVRSGRQSLVTVGKLASVALCGGLATLVNP